jgi:hypothetical protein
MMMRLRATTTVFAYLPRLAGLQSASTRQQIEDDDNHCQHKQDVDEAATDVKGKAKKPEDNENDDNSPKHKIVLRSNWSRIKVPPQASWRSLW